MIRPHILAGLFGGMVGGSKSVRPVTPDYRFMREEYTSASFDSFSNRIAILITNDTPFIQLSWYLWYLQAQRVMTIGMSPVTISNVAVDVVAAGTPVTFGGSSRVLNMTPGNSDRRGNEVYASSVGLEQFAAGSTVYIKWDVNIETAGVDKVYFSSSRLKKAGEQVLRYKKSDTTVSAAEIPGNFTTTTGVAANTTLTNPIFSPVVLGLHGNPAGVIIGDSIANGAIDTASYGGFEGGYLQRSLRQADNSKPRPSINMAIGGANMRYIYSSLNGPLVEPYLAMCQFAAIMGFTNDVNGTSPLSYYQGQEESVIALVKGQGIKWIIQSGLFPRTSSTDQYVTLANQTPNAGWAPGQVAQQINAYLAGLVGTSIDGYYEPTPVRDAGEPTKWAVNGAALYMVDSIGTHPQPVGHTAMATPLRAIVDATVPFIN